MKIFSTHSRKGASSEGDAVLERSTIPIPQPGKGLLRAFSSLRQRNFRLYWFGQLISLLGTWMQKVGQAFIASRPLRCGRVL